MGGRGRRCLRGRWQTQWLRSPLVAAAAAGKGKMGRMGFERWRQEV